jgi:hypothetical protein
MDKLTVRTNNVPRDILSWFDLTEREQKEFDYLDTEERRMDTSFFRYKGNVYDLGDAMGIFRSDTCQMDPLRDWHGYYGDSYFSGVLVRYADEFERVVVGQYFS